MTTTPTASPLPRSRDRRAARVAGMACRRCPRGTRACWSACVTGRATLRTAPDSKVDRVAGARWTRSSSQATGPTNAIIVFTEYRDTQRWLHERLLVGRIPAGADRPALRRPGPRRARTHQVRVPRVADLDPVRILLATDAASEGINLQTPLPPACCTGRSRGTRTGWSSATAASTGTASTPPRWMVHHFVPAGLADAPTSPAARWRTSWSSSRSR